MYQSFGPIAAFVLALGIAGYIVQSRLPPPKPKVIGIDLGTTYSCVGVYNAIFGNVTVFEDNDGHRVVPSVVAFQDDRILVGYSASRQAEENPSNTLFDSKRFIGKIYRKSSIDYFESLQKSYPFELKLDTEGKALFGVKANDKLVYKSPEEVGAILLATLKRTAEERLMDKVSKAVISVPAEFNGKQRNATIAAGRKAGLEVLRIINEPTAAAMAYGMHKKSGSNMIIVIDFGGGTLDVSLLSVRGGMFVTLAMAGNNRLGGQDINENLFLYFWQELLAINCKLTAIQDVQHLRDQVEVAKLGLTFSNKTYITVTTRDTKACPLGEGNGNVKLSISRSKFEEINASLFVKILVPIHRVLKEVEIEVKNIDEIILVGGSTRIPKVRQLVTEFFGKKPNTEIDPDIAVVTGVAVQAGILSGAWPLQVSAVEIPRNDLHKLDVTAE